VLENKEVIEPELLEPIAKALKLPVEAIKSFDEEKAVNERRGTTRFSASRLLPYLVSSVPAL
jgi:hypothetical protein